MNPEYRNTGAFEPTWHELQHLHDAGKFFSLPKSKARLGLTFLRQLLCATSLLMTIKTADADPLTTINTLRAEGCAGEAPAGTVVVPSESLNKAARELALDGQLGNALERTGYSAASSVAVYVKGRTDDAAIRQIIEDRDCAAVNNPQLDEIGIYGNGNEIWIVLAARMKLPAIDDAAAIAARVLELVNVARASSRQCGDHKFEAAPPLTLSPVLNEVALLHAQDMAQQRVMQHRGSDGSQPQERVTRAGYRWRAAGENVAAGQPDAETVVAGWLDSPGHCANIMAPQFKEMGVAFALVSGNPPIYWAQEFAAPR